MLNQQRGGFNPMGGQKRGHAMMNGNVAGSFIPGAVGRVPVPESVAGISPFSNMFPPGPEDNLPPKRIRTDDSIMKKVSERKGAAHQLCVCMHCMAECA